MIYNASKHSLEEDNGKTVAIFDSSIRADKAFKIADNINDWKAVPDLESNIDVLDHEKGMLEEHLDQLNDEVTDLETEISFLTNQLDEIYDAVSEDYSKEDMVEIIKSICLRK